MKNYIAAALLAICGIAHAADDDLYDGLTGVDCRAFNGGGGMFWKHVGGDWIDADGVAQGGKPFASVAVKALQKGEVSVDIPVPLIDSGIILRRSPRSGTHYFHARESATPPRLQVLTGSGETVEVTPIADSSIPYDGTKCTTTQAIGTAVRLGISWATAIQFPAVPDAVSAKLVLTISSSSAATRLNVFKLVRPATDVQVTTGLAAKYPGDVGIENDPAVLHVDRYERTGREYTPNAGVTGAALTGRFPVNSTGGLSSATGTVVVPEREEMYARYYLKLINFRDAISCDGGKLFGISGSTAACGNGGAQANGWCGWSMRMSYTLNCDKANPVYPKVRHGVYAYHAEQPGAYGQQFSSADGGTHGLMPLDEWVCLEERVKVNTPGIKDGIVQTWVNGKLGVDRQNVLMRHALTPERPAYDIPGSLGITKFWGTLHHGGKNPMGVAATAYIDNLVIASERIGCIEPTPKPEELPPEDPPVDTPPVDTPPEDPPVDVTPADPVPNEADVLRKQLEDARTVIDQIHTLTRPQ